MGENVCSSGASVSADSLMDADRHQYLVHHDDWMGGGVIVGGNGLVDVADGVLYVITGTDAGDVAVHVEIHVGEPRVDVDDWDEIVDVSFQAERPIVFATLFGDTNPELPNLAFNGPGIYRIRICARGRDTAADYEYEDESGSPTEHHAIFVWPAPIAPLTVHKASDDFGRRWREGWASNKS